MALVDPNIAMGFRPTQFEQRNPLQEYAQIQQLQTSQLQNQLARQQMEQEQGVIDYLNRADLSTPSGVSGLSKFGKTGLGYQKLLTEQQTNELKRQELKGKVRDQQMTALGTGLTSVLNDPSDSSLTAAFDRLDATGVDTTRFRQSLLSEPDLAKRKAVITQYVTSNPEGRQALTFVQPKPEKFDLNGKIVVIDTNPNSPTYKQQVQEFEKTATIADKFAREKFNWEKANPGFELRETEDGNVVGVNKRTLQAFPVMMGGAAPVAPATPVDGSPRVPANNLAPTPANVNRLTPASSQVIPGMNSVLDQRAPAAPVATTTPQMPQAGMPLKGARKEAPAKFNDTDMQLAGLAGSLKEFKDEVGKNLTTGAKFLPSGADTARMQAKYTSLLMGVKDLYTLGALAGPDMAIIESQLTNPASWSGKFTTKKGFEEQIQVIEDMLKRSATNVENTYGRTPKATREALKGLPSGGSGGFAGATADNPLGLPGR